MNKHFSLPPDEPLQGHLHQSGTIPGETRLTVFQEALRLRNTPPLYSQETVSEKQVSVKFFNPCNSWTWYAVEWDGKEKCFGYVVGHVGEWGDFDLRELAFAEGRLGIGIEVDECFTPQRVPIKERNFSTTHEKEDQGFEPGD